MATDALYRRARSRASENTSGDVPQKNDQVETLDAIRTMQVAAEAIDAMTLGVEVMIQDQRRMMRQENVVGFMLENELWSGMTTLLTMVRHHALDIASKGEAAEKAAMHADRVAAA